MSTYTKFSRLSLAAKIKRAKNLQAKYFTGENIPIYGINCFHYLIAGLGLGYLADQYALLSRLMLYFMLEASVWLKSCTLPII